MSVTRCTKGEDKPGAPARNGVAGVSGAPSWSTLGEGRRHLCGPLAHRILGANADAAIAQLAAGDPAQSRMRTFMAARSRFAEDCLALAVARGIRQAVILGAGLDTFSLQNPGRGQGLRVCGARVPQQGSPAASMRK